MNNYYFTFGFDHLHPVTNESMGKKYIKITANDDNVARVAMIGLFGTNWAMAYREKEFLPQIEKYGLTEVDHEGKNVAKNI